MPAEPITLADRLVTAVISVIAAVLTATVIGTLLLFRAGEASSMQFWAGFLRWSGGFAVLAAVVGFIVGPERAAEYWGLIWGTEEEEKHRGPVVFVALLVTFVCVMVLLWEP